MSPLYHQILLFTVLILLQSPWVLSQTAPPISLSGCKHKCGGINVPYPFGFEPGCFREDFGLVCNESYNSPRLFIDGWGYPEITDISPEGEMHISFTSSHACYDSNGNYISGDIAGTQLMLASPYILSLSNRFFALGCPVQGLFLDGSSYYISGCISACRPPQYSLDGTNNGSCTGVGCCQSSIPRGLNFYGSVIQNIRGSVGDDRVIFDQFTNCLFAFLADPNRFLFDNSYLSKTDDFMVDVAIDWAVRNVGNCSYARRNMTDFACQSANHDCYDSHNGAGYLCNCSKGYQGNPYIPDGCEGIIYTDPSYFT